MYVLVSSITQAERSWELGGWFFSPYCTHLREKFHQHLDEDDEEEAERGCTKCGGEMDEDGEYCNDCGETCSDADDDNEDEDFGGIHHHRHLHAVRPAEEVFFAAFPAFVDQQSNLNQQ